MARENLQSIEERLRRAGLPSAYIVKHIADVELWRSLHKPRGLRRHRLWDDSPPPPRKYVKRDP